MDANDHAPHERDAIGLAKFELLIKSLPRARKVAPKGSLQEDLEGTMIFDAARRKLAPEAAVIPEHQIFHWPILSAPTGPSRRKRVQDYQGSDHNGERFPGRYSCGRVIRLLPPCQDHPPWGSLLLLLCGGLLSGPKVNGIEIKEEHILKNKVEAENRNCTFVFTQSFLDAPE
jgi:hypothetical protein